LDALAISPFLTICDSRVAIVDLCVHQGTSTRSLPDARHFSPAAGQPESRAKDGCRALPKGLDNAGMQFDIHFRVLDAATTAVVLESGCYQFTVSP
jgi:hypothetical protein